VINLRIHEATALKRSGPSAANALNCLGATSGLGIAQRDGMKTMKPMKPIFIAVCVLVAACGLPQTNEDQGVAISQAEINSDNGFSSNGFSTNGFQPTGSAPTGSAPTGFQPTV
jgi:hypothetical protein